MKMRVYPLPTLPLRKLSTNIHRQQYYGNFPSLFSFRSERTCADNAARHAS